MQVRMGTEKNEEVRLGPAGSSHSINSKMKKKKKKNMIKRRIPTPPHDYQLERKYRTVCKKKNIAESHIGGVFNRLEIPTKGLHFHLRHGGLGRSEVLASVRE